MTPGQNARGPRLWLWCLATLALVIIFGLLLQPTAKNGEASISTNQPSAQNGAGVRMAKLPRHFTNPLRRHQGESEASAGQIVAGKLKTFAVSRRKLAQGLAQRHGITVPASVEKFFDAVEAGNWDEIKARYHEINSGDGSATTHAGRPPDIQALWPAIVDAFGAAEQVHLWPPQQLLDYGNSVMNSLSPGMVYVGGTDDGRWVPELMNESSGDTPHIMLTQNGLADDGYLDYVNLQYGDQLATLTAADADQATQNYLADYQQRLAHDQQFPNEPPQIRPGEAVSIGSNGQPQVSGPSSQVSVMAINENLLNMLMNENPQLSFGLQESYPLKSTYGDALPLGPIMELRAADAQNTFTPDIAAQSLSYWNTRTEQLLSDPDAAGSSEALKVYAKDEAAAANLLAAHNYTAEAGQMYGSAVQLAPDQPGAVSGYVNFLLGQNQPQQAIAVAQNAIQANPNNQQLQNLLNQAKAAAH